MTILCWFWGVLICSPAMSKQNRQDLVALLNVTSATSEEKYALSRIWSDGGGLVPHSSSSFVELPPLIIAGAVAAAGAVGVGLAAAAASAALLLTVGSILAMGAFLGWYNSHKDRRRQIDQLPACESTHPLDTNDPDCFARRWQIMSDYYPWNHELRRGDRILMTQESDIETLGNKNHDNAVRNEEILLGPKGLVWESGVVLEPGSMHLHDAKDKILTRLGEMQNELKNTADSDAIGLRSNIQYAASRFLQDASSVLESQAVSSDMNMNRLLQAATSGLTHIMSDMIGYQHTLARKSVDIYKPASKLYAQTVGKLNYYSKKIDLFEGSLHSMESSFGDQADSAFRILRQKILDSQSDINAYFKDAMNVSNVVWDRTEDAITSNLLGTAGQLRREGGLSSTVTSELDKNLKTVTDLELDVTRRSRSDVTKVLQDSSDEVSQSADSIFSGVKNQQSKMMRLNAGLSRTSAKLANLVDAQSAEIREDAGEVLQEIDTEKHNVLNRVYNALSKVVSNHNLGMKPIVRSLSDAAVDSSQRITNKELTYTGKSANTMKHLGSQGVLVSSANSDLLSLLTLSDSNHAKTIQQVNDALSSDRSTGDIQAAQLISAIQLLLKKQQSLKSDQEESQNSISTAISRGGNQAKQSVSSAHQGALGDVSDLGNSVLGSAMTSLIQGNDASQSLKVLSRLGASSRSYSDTVSRIIRSTANSQSLNLADLALALAGADDAAVDQYTGTVDKQGNSGSISTKFLDPTNEIIQEIIYQLSERKTAINNTEDAGAMESTEAAERKSTSLAKSLDDANIQTSDSIDTVRRTVSDRFSQLGQGANNTANSLISKVANFPLDSAELASFIRDYVRQKSESISPLLDMSNEDISSLMARLSRSANAGPSTIPGNRSEEYVAAMAAVDRLLETQSHQMSDFEKRAQNLSSELWDGKRNVSIMLNSVLGVIRNQVMSIPSAIAAVMNVATDPTFQMSYMSIDASIQKLREKLAVTTSKEDRIRLTADLVLLTRMKHLSFNLTQESETLRQKIDSERSTGMRAMNLTNHAIEHIVKTVVAYHVQDDRNSSEYVQAIAESSATLLNGLKKLSDDAVDQLGSNISESLSSQAFDFKLHQNEHVLAGNSAKGNLDQSFGVTDDVVGQLLFYTDQFEETIEETQNSTSLTREGVGGRIREVLAQIASGTALLQSQANSDDVLTQLGSVKYAVNRLMGLLFEFGEASSDSISRQWQAAVDEKDLMEANAVNLLSQSIANLQKYTNSSTTNLKTTAESEWDKLEDFQDSFDESVDDLVREIHVVHDIRYNKTLNIDYAISRLSDLSINLSSEAIIDIQSELDKFDQLANLQQDEYTN
jgi:hypothetical protein